MRRCNEICRKRTNVILLKINLGTPTPNLVIEYGVLSVFLRTDLDGIFHTKPRIQAIKCNQ